MGAGGRSQEVPWDRNYFLKHSQLGTPRDATKRDLNHHLTRPESYCSVGQGSERLRHMSEVSQLTNSRARVGRQVHLTPESELCLLLHKSLDQSQTVQSSQDPAI